MNGPEHYVEAERLQKLYEDSSTPNHQDWAAQWGAQALAAAQVHATLALVAATVDAAADTYGAQWADVTE